MASVTKVENIQEETVINPITGVETWIDGLFHNTSRKLKLTVDATSISIIKNG